MTVRSGLSVIAAALILLAGAAYAEHGTVLHYALASAGILLLASGTVVVLKARRAVHESKMHSP